MGPHKHISSISQEKWWVHSLPSAVFLSTRTGPYTRVGNISHKTWWAHTGVSVVFFGIRDRLTSVLATSLRWNSGPIHCHWQYFYPSEWAHTRELVEVTVGPFMTIGSNFQHQEWAYTGYWQYLSGDVAGPFMTIDSIFQHQVWAHLWPSAQWLGNNDRPIHDHRHHFFWRMNGPTHHI